MSGAAAAGAAVAAAHAAAVQAASNASGIIVRVKPEVFLTLLERAGDEALVVQDEVRAGFLTREQYHYLMGYKGLAFVTSSPEPLTLPEGIETILAEKMWIPV